MSNTRSKENISKGISDCKAIVETLILNQRPALRQTQAVTYQLSRVYEDFARLDQSLRELFDLLDYKDEELKRKYL